MIRFPFFPCAALGLLQCLALITIDREEATTGCQIPDLRFVRPKKFGSTTTEQPYVTFETTQIFLPDEFTTADLEDYAERSVDETLSTETDAHTSNLRLTRYTDYNPYAWHGGDG